MKSIYILICLIIPMSLRANFQSHICEKNFLQSLQAELKYNLDQIVDEKAQLALLEFISAKTDIMNSSRDIKRIAIHHFFPDIRKYIYRINISPNKTTLYFSVTVFASWPGQNILQVWNIEDDISELPHHIICHAHIGIQRKAMIKNIITKKEVAHISIDPFLSVEIKYHNIKNEKEIH